MSFQLSYLFTDHMVLQRDKKIAVFGSGKTGSKITVSLLDDNGEVITSSACVPMTTTGVIADSKFLLYLPPLSAGGPYTLNVTDGVETLEYHDVMLGDLWLAGGQSNMEFNLQSSDEYKDMLAEVRTGSFPYHLIRHYFVPHISYVDDNKGFFPGLYNANSWGKSSSGLMEGTRERGMLAPYLSCNENASIGGWYRPDPTKSRVQASKFACPAINGMERFKYASANAYHANGIGESGRLSRCHVESVIHSSKVKSPSQSMFFAEGTTSRVAYHSAYDYPVSPHNGGTTSRTAGIFIPDIRDRERISVTSTYPPRPGELRHQARCTDHRHL